MKKTLLFIAFSSLFLQLKAQTTYDFGTTNQATIAPLYVSGSTAPQWPLDTGSPYILCRVWGLSVSPQEITQLVMFNW